MTSFTNRYSVLRPPDGPRTRTPQAMSALMSRKAVSVEQAFIFAYLEVVKGPSKPSSRRLRPYLTRLQAA